MLTCTALTHGSNEGHGKKKLLYFILVTIGKSQLHLISSSLVPPAVLHSGQVTHTRTKSTLKQHNPQDKKNH